MGSATKAEKKDKKRKQSESTADVVLADEPKAKKRKRDREPAEDAPIDAAPTEATDQPSLDEMKRKKKKDRKHKELSPAVPVEDEQPADAPKRKSKKRDSAPAVEAERPAADDAGDLEDPSPTKKKKKKRKDQTADEEDVAGEKPARTSKKYPDPVKDETLNEQSQKGLAYAHSYATSSDWKFNKARQNWLMKHVYDPAVVPDEYLRMVFHYLKSIKGQALEHLRKTSQSIVDSPTSQEPADSAAPTNGAEETQRRVDRASSLLKKLPQVVAVPVVGE